MQALKGLPQEETASAEEVQRQVRPALRPVPALAAMSLGRLVAKEASGWRVRIGAVEHVLPVDGSVDPALLDEALATGARVVVDASEEPIIAGLLATQRAVTVDRHGDVDARVRTFTVTVREKALLRAPGAFLQLTAAELELYADRVLTRAREMAKTLATLIKLN